MELQLTGSVAMAYYMCGRRFSGLLLACDRPFSLSYSAPRILCFTVDVCFGLHEGACPVVAQECGIVSLDLRQGDISSDSSPNHCPSPVSEE